MDGSLGEAVTRFALCELFPGKEFHKTRRPAWLCSLELDGFNEELGLAFEYHGKQHFEYVPLFHHYKEVNFERQKERDALKEDLCVSNLVSLIVITYRTPLEEIRSVVRNQVKDLRYLFPLGRQTLSHEEFVPKAVEHYQRSKMTLGEEDVKRVKGDVESCGYTFVCMLDRYVTSDRTRPKMKIKCPRGHKIEILFDNFFPIHSGKPHRGCMLCARKRTNGEKGETWRKEYMKKYGLEALDPYGSRHKAARWKCIKAGHVFTASWNTIVARKCGKCLDCNKERGRKRGRR